VQSRIARRAVGIAAPAVIFGAVLLGTVGCGEDAEPTTELTLVPEISSRVPFPVLSWPPTTAEQAQPQPQPAPPVQTATPSMIQSSGTRTQQRTTTRSKPPPPPPPTSTTTTTPHPTT
jgi:hypothetical protein